MQTQTIPESQTEEREKSIEHARRFLQLIEYDERIQRKEEESEIDYWRRLYQLLSKMPDGHPIFRETNKIKLLNGILAIKTNLEEIERMQRKVTNERKEIAAKLDVTKKVWWNPISWFR